MGDLAFLVASNNIPKKAVNGNDTKNTIVQLNAIAAKKEIMLIMESNIKILDSFAIG